MFELQPCPDLTVPLPSAGAPLSKLQLVIGAMLASPGHLWCSAPFPELPMIAPPLLMTMWTTHLIATPWLKSPVTYIFTDLDCQYLYTFNSVLCSQTGNPPVAPVIPALAMATLVHPVFTCAVIASCAG